MLRNNTCCDYVRGKQTCIETVKEVLKFERPQNTKTCSVMCGRDHNAILNDQLFLLVFNSLQIKTKSKTKKLLNKKLI